MNVYDTANNLAEEIRKSEIYKKNLKNQKTNYMPIQKKRS